MDSRSSVAHLPIKVGIFLLAFIVMSFAILHRPNPKFQDFDQIFYVTIAYDLDKYGVFSNGIFDSVPSTVIRPPPGMFFGPLFPAIVFATMKLDSRFAESVRCSVESNHGQRDEATCEAYGLPIRILNAFFLAIGILAVASAAELIFGRARWSFVLSGLLATAALAAEADTFSFVMTESLLFSLYSIFAWALLRAAIMDGAYNFAAAGIVLSLLCLSKPSFVALFPAGAAILLYCGLKFAKTSTYRIACHLVVFAGAFACIIVPWIARNYVSVGKLGLTEEYGSAAVVERFAYDNMTAREFFLAFPYCTPGVGELFFDKMYGTDSMHRFVFHTPGSFFHAGRNRRDALLREYGQLDPLIGSIIREEMRTNWWRYLLVSIPLIWCGMWAGGVLTLVLLPLFGWSLLHAVRCREPFLIVYTLPAVLILALNAAVGNHLTRYNLILIGPYSAGAWIASALLCAHWSGRFRARRF
jgi:hypothetical protein